MRPRSFERGKVRVALRVQITVWSFNEAALFRTRKAARSFARRLVFACFNEAALFRTRKVGIQRVHCCYRQVLQ